MMTIELSFQLYSQICNPIYFLMISRMGLCQHYEGILAAWLARKSGQSYRHPFNYSVYKNITPVSLYPCVVVLFILLVAK
jgi:palmitoyltransferase